LTPGMSSPPPNRAGVPPCRSTPVASHPQTDERGFPCPHHLRMHAARQPRCRRLRARNCSAHCCDLARLENLVTICNSPKAQLHQVRQSRAGWLQRQLDRTSAAYRTSTSSGRPGISSQAKALGIERRPCARPADPPSQYPHLYRHQCSGASAPERSRPCRLPLAQGSRHPTFNV
jgi:hypothetical protein